MRRSALLTVVLPGIVIAGVLVLAYVEMPVRSGVEVRSAVDASVRITKPGRRETLAGGRLEAGRPLRLRLEPGSYVVRTARQPRLRARPVRVYVPPERFVDVRLRYVRRD
jgi:hypothetical protein